MALRESGSGMSSNKEKDLRKAALENWLSDLGESTDSLRPVAADAGSRRYFRFDHQDTTRIAVDAPPETAENSVFLEVTEELEAAGIRVPRQYNADLSNGFLVMEDFGDQLFADAIETGDQSQYYEQAADLLAKLHALPTDRRAPYDRELITRELSQFTTHYLGAFNASLTPDQAAQWNRFCRWLSDAFFDMPPVWTHRDFHCRNILVLENQTLGLIDYQGALAAPPGYDLASLLRDCYQDVTEVQFEQVVARYASARGIGDTDALIRNIDLLGMQRHLKCMGAFVRFDRELNKPQFLNALPQTAAYLRRVAQRHDEANCLLNLLREYPEDALQ